MATMKSGKRSSGRTAGISKRARKKGTVYEVRYRVGEAPNVKQYSRSFDTEAEAKAFKDSVKAQVRANEWADPVRARTPWAVVADEWLNDKRDSLKERTVRGHRFTVNTLNKRWAHKSIGSVTRADITALMRDMKDKGRKPQTIQNVFNVVSGVLDYAVEERYVSHNPARFKRQRQKRQGTSGQERRYLAPHEVEILASHMPAPYDLLVRLAAWSGLRAGELAGLRVSRVLVAQSRIRVVETVVDMGKEGLRPDTPKSESSLRMVPIAPTLMRQVAAHIASSGLGPDDYVFGVAGKPHDHDEFYRNVFVPATKKAGLAPLRFHDLRHTYASIMHAQGRTMLEVSKWMGHSTYLLTANTYSHLFDGEDSSVTNELDSGFIAATTQPANVTSLPVRRSG